MSDLDTISNELSGYRTLLYERIRNATRFVRGGMVLGGAGMAGYAQFMQPAGEATSNAFSNGQMLGFIGVALAGLGGVWSLFVDESAPDLLKNAENAIEIARKSKIELDSKQQELQLKQSEMKLDEEAYESAINWLSTANAAYGAMRELVENIFVSHGKKDFAPEEHIQVLIDGFARLIHGLMNFSGGGYWTISIYKYNEIDGGKLVHVAGHKADRKDEQSAHRTWGVGEGIAGHVFQIKREQVVADARSRDTAGWLNIPKHLERIDDDKKYVSLVAVPISIAGQDVPWGVVAATSDESGHFSVDDAGEGTLPVDILRQLTGMVALLVSGAYIGAGHNTVESTRLVKGQREKNASA